MRMGLNQDESKNNDEGMDILVDLGAAGNSSLKGNSSGSSRQGNNCCSPSGKRWAWGIGVFVLLITTISLIAVSLRKLSSTEYGVQYNSHSKKLYDAARTGGIHVGPPGFEFIKFPSTFITLDLPVDTCLSLDGLRVQFSVTFQYQMPTEWLIPAVLKYRDYEKWTKVVEAAGNSAVQHSCSVFNISNFQNKRGIIQATMEDNLRVKLEGTKEDGSDGVYARALSLQLRDVKIPEIYQAAIAEKQAATEDIVLAQNQRIQAITKANTALLSAREEVRIINNTAINDVDIILTEARLSAQQDTFAFETEAGIIVKVKESLNLTIDGVLAYMSNRLYAQASNLKVSAAEPARLSRNDEL